MARSKRVRLTQAGFDEIIESRDWCAKNGYDGFVRWYDELLDFYAHRRVLPHGVQPAMDDEDGPART